MSAQFRAGLKSPCKRLKRQRTQNNDGFRLGVTRGADAVTRNRSFDESISSSSENRQGTFWLVEADELSNS